MNAKAPIGAMLSRARQHRDGFGTAVFGGAGRRLMVDARRVRGCVFATIGSAGRS